MTTIKANGDAVNHPKHYNSLPAKCECGKPIECIQVVEHMDFLIGNIIKYAWRAGAKDGTSALQDLEKMLWYAQRAVDKEKAKSEANN